jgi:hypothetical protein
MPNNPIIEALMNIVGSPQTGRGLLNPQNIMDALKLTGQQYTGQAPLEPSVGMPGSPMPMPGIDLGRISVPVSRQQPQASMMPQPPMPPMNIASPMENMGQIQQAKPQSNGINWQMLMDIGIPALSAIIGTAAPGTLAGAAGLSKGYTDTREKQREAEKTKRVRIFDEETGEITDSGQVIKATDEILKKSKTKEDFRDTLIKELLGLDVPDTKTGESLKTNNKITVEKDGNQFLLPADQQDEAIKQGYKLVK